MARWTGGGRRSASSTNGRSSRGASSPAAGRGAPRRIRVRLRYWSYAPPRTWVPPGRGRRGRVPGLPGLDDAPDLVRLVGLAVLVLLVSVTRITVSHYGLSFDITGLRRVSCYAFVAAVGDPRRRGGPAARGLAAGPVGEQLVPRRDAGLPAVHRRRRAGAPKSLWVRDPSRFREAVLGRPRRDGRPQRGIQDEVVAREPDRLTIKAAGSPLAGRAGQMTGASGLRSRTAAGPHGPRSAASVTTAAASRPGPRWPAARATAACRADSRSEGRSTVAAVYVRPSVSRTAAPSAAPVRARRGRGPA